MIRYIIFVSLCWAVFYGFYQLWLKRETFFAVNRWYLLGSLLLGLCIPLLELPALKGSAAESLSMVYQTPVIIGAEWLEVSVAAENNTASGPSLWLILSWLYILGVVLTFLRFIFGLLQIYRLYRGAEISARPGFKLVRTNRPHLPFSFFNLLFQSRATPFGKEEEQQIHRHELAHISGWHSIDVLLVELIGVVLWCSPMIYLYRRSLRDVHEFLADAAVLKTMRRKQYSKLLLRQFQSGLQLALANHFLRSQFKNRINMMTKKRSRNEALLKYLLILPILAFAVFLFAKRSALTENASWLQKQAAEINHAVSDSVRQTADIMPQFPGCGEFEIAKEQEACAQKKFLTYIYKGIRYPAAARKAGIQGTVVVRFIIDAEGYLQEPNVQKTPGGGLGEEVVRLLREMPQWIPGQDQGEAVAVQMTLPVKFALEGKNQKESAPAEQYDLMPVFSGCEDLDDPAKIKLCTAKRLTQFMQKHIQYPADAKKLGIEGKVLVQITIDETGKVAKTEIQKSVHNELDMEALRVANLLPDWKPAEKAGKVVSSKITLPITFDLPIEHQAVVIGYKLESKVDAMPRFPGCENSSDEQFKINCSKKSFLSYIFKNVKYPKIAKDRKIEGTVTASFEVDEQGRVGEVKILRSVSREIDAEVERVLLEMNNLPERWTPGRKDGKVVKTQMTIPVKFALNEKESSRDLAPLELADFSLSPNPNQGQFQLIFQADALPTFIRVTDGSGKLVLEEKLASFNGRYQGSLRLKQTSGGAYFLSITQEGKKPFTHKFIVQ